MQTNILEYLPPVLANIKEMIAHAKAEKPELEFLWNAMESAYTDQFLYSMGEDAILRWEKSLGIFPQESQSIEERRIAIIEKLNSQLPYTFKMLQNYLEKVCGKNGYTMAYDKSNWTLTIRVALNLVEKYEEVLSVVKEVIPLNLILYYDLLYNKYENLSLKTYGELEEFSYGSLRNNIIHE